jgi:hypothetical protein
MAKQSVIQCEVREFTQIPYNLVVVYKNKGVFSDMLQEMLPKYPELLGVLGDPSINNNLAFAIGCEESPNIFIFFNDDCALDVIVHEVTHTVFSVFRRIGAEISEDSEEFFAYLMEFNFKEVGKIIYETFKLKMRLFY